MNIFSNFLSTIDRHTGGRNFRKLSSSGERERRAIFRGRENVNLWSLSPRHTKIRPFDVICVFFIVPRQILFFSFLRRNTLFWQFTTCFLLGLCAWLIIIHTIRYTLKLLLMYKGELRTLFVIRQVGTLKLSSRSSSNRMSRLCTY